MAQLVEHILGKDEVISSNLISSSNPTDLVGFLVCIGICLDKLAYLCYTNLNTFKGVDHYVCNDFIPEHHFNQIE